MSLKGGASLLSKVMALVVFVLVLAAIALVASLAFSGYQEQSVFATRFEQEFATGGAITNSNFVFSRSQNGSLAIITQIEIPNNMTYPISVALSGTSLLGQYVISSFASNSGQIQPGQVGSMVLAASANLSKVESDPSLLSSMLVSSVPVETNVSALLSIDQLASVQFWHTLNWTVGPILRQFNVSAGTPTLSSDGSNWILPLTVAWNNTTPLGFSASLSGVISQMPGKAPGGNYASAYSSVNMTAGENRAVLDFFLPTASFGYPSSGAYSFNLTFSAGNSSSATIRESVNI